MIIQSISDKELKKKYLFTKENIQWVNSFKHLWSNEYTNLPLISRVGFKTAEGFKTNLLQKYGKRWNVTKKFLAELVQCFSIDKPYSHNLVLVIEGTQGSGKSYGAIFMKWLKCHFEHYHGITKTLKFDVKNIVYTMDEFVKRSKLADKKPNMFLISDETTMDRVLGVQSYAMSVRKEQIIDTTRKKKLHTAHLKPQMQNVVPYHYYFRTHGINYQKKVNVLIWGTDPNTPIGSIFTELVPQKILDAYENKKNSFLNKLLKESEEIERVKKYFEIAVETINRFKLIIKQRTRFRNYIILNRPSQTMVADVISYVSNYMNILLDPYVRESFIEGYRKQLYCYDKLVRMRDSQKTLKTYK